MGDLDGGRTLQADGADALAPSSARPWRLHLPRKKASGNGKKKPQRVGPRIRPPVYYVPMLPTPVIELDFLGLLDRRDPIATNATTRTAARARP